jgi:hypothetical protein
VCGGLFIVCVCVNVCRCGVCPPLRNHPNHNYTSIQASIRTNHQPTTIPTHTNTHPKQVKPLIEKALKQKLSEAFFRFEEEALASASIAQVHRAVLKDGTDVVVKVQHPGERNPVHTFFSSIYSNSHIRKEQEQEQEEGKGSATPTNQRDSPPTRSSPII